MIKRKLWILLITILFILSMNYNFHNASVFSEDKIRINIPHTKYNILNEKIKSIAGDYVKEFKKVTKEQDKMEYYLYIYYDSNTYKNIMSIILHIEIFSGGAHPNHYIETINYDIKRKEIITIDSLMMINEDILDILQKESRRILSSLDIFKDKATYNMMLEGTTLKKENFRNFIFTDTGMKIHFSRYQIAPYFYGEYSVTISYNEVKIDNLFD